MKTKMCTLLVITMALLQSCTGKLGLQPEVTTETLPPPPVSNESVVPQQDKTPTQEFAIAIFDDYIEKTYGLTISDLPTKTVTSDYLNHLTIIAL